MDAPKCKLCGERHWGDCPSLQSRKIAARDPVWGHSRPPLEAAPRAVATDQPLLAAKRSKGKGGRPRIGTEANTITHQKPWLAEGMSERTWYRRQREKAK